MKIGVISDTHGFLDPKVHRLFTGVEHILHAGDVGSRSLLVELERIAPVTAVLGNTDTWTSLKPTEFVEVGALQFLIHHIVNPHELTDDLKARIEQERPDAVIFGHTHKQFCETIDGVLYFNPGYAGKKRFSLERSVAIFLCDKKGIRPEFLSL